MSQRILVSTQMMIHDQMRFRGWLEELGFEVDFLMNEQFLDENDCLVIEPIYDGWVAGDDQVTSKVIDHLKSRLKVISKWGTGIDSIDKDYAENNGVSIKNTTGAFSESVGEMAVSYLLALTRGIVETDKKVRNGGWPKKQYKTLVGMKVGFIGMGAIGQGAAKRLDALGCDISYSDPSVQNQDYKIATVKEMFSTADAIIITSNLNPSTYKLVNKNLFELSELGLYLVNVGRGSIVDEVSLVEALKSGKVIGAALDVFEQEPLPESSPLYSSENLILGSHNANNTYHAVEYVHQNTINMLTDALKYYENDCEKL